MNNNQDAAFAEAMAQEGTGTTPAPEAIEETPAAEPALEETSASENVELPPEENTPFPKKAVNKINRKERDIRKLRSQNRALKDEVTAYQAAKAAAAENVEPSEEEYESYGDFLKARQDWLQSKSSQESSDAKSMEDFERRGKALEAQRTEYIAETREEFFASVPDAQGVMQAAGPLLQKLPNDISEIIFELDNPVAAIYDLAKAGKLEYLGDMVPALAAVELVAAQKRGQTLSSVPDNAGDTPPANPQGGGEVTPSMPPKPAEGPPASNSPRPLAPAKGSGKAKTKSLGNMTPRELVKWAKT